MKTLSIRQPWASLIAHGIKDIENRSWKTNYRGAIYIHASSPKKFKVDMNDECAKAAIPIFETAIKGTMPFGAIIGEVEIIGCMVNHPSIWAEKADDYNPQIHEYTPRVWNWVLANPVLYDEPILNVKGKLSFWEYHK